MRYLLHWRYYILAVRVGSLRSPIYVPRPVKVAPFRLLLIHGIANPAWGVKMFWKKNSR